MVMRKRFTVDEVQLLAWGYQEMQRQMQPREDDIMGYCPGCDVWPRRCSECRQVERDERCVYACRTCGETIDEAYVPF
jgi:hypothetical protein